MKTGGAAIKVALVEDGDFFHANLKQWLNRSAVVKCIGSYSNSSQALRCILRDRPGILVVDGRGQSKMGITRIRRLKSIFPNTRIVLVAGKADKKSILCGLMAGADGYLVEPVSRAALLQAVQTVSCGEPVLPKGVLKLLVESLHQSSSAVPRKSLSPREEETMFCVCQGYRDKEIAQVLKVGVRTVQTHVYRALRKLRSRNRREAAEKFLQV